MKHLSQEVGSFLPLIIIALHFSAVSSHTRADDWLQIKRSHYTIFYKTNYEKDTEFTRTWMDQTEQLMKTKYGVTPTHYQISVYLFDEPADGLSTDLSGRNRCCSRTSPNLNTGRIDLLTISAPVWKSSNLKSSLGLAKSGEDYHAKVLVSEYIPIGHYAAQDSRPSGGWSYYSAPNWFVQGLQEYDAIFHSTENNRTMTAKRLIDWAKRNPTKFSCCTPKLEIADDYNGGAAFMTFLADKFGERIHAKLLRSSAPSFESALANETKPYTLAQLFELFREWLDQK
jgi:hypothetical protein